MSSIGIDWKILIPQIINFLILFLILRWLLYKPILKILGERKRKIEESMALAEKTKKESEELEIRNQEKIAKVKEEAKIIIDQTREQVQEEAKKMKEETAREIEKLKEKSRGEIEFERKKMVASLREELANLILLASGKLTRESVTIEVQKQLVNEIIEELKNKDFEENN